jgi:TolB-like protein
VDDIFDVQDTITAEVTAAVEPSLIEFNARAKSVVA